MSDKCFECESELTKTCLSCNTRSTPSADPLAGLVRYTFMKREGLLSSVDPTSYGRYVLHSEVVKIVAMQAVEIEKLKDQNDKFKWQVRDTCTRAETAEAELAISKTERHADGEYIGSLEAELAQIKAQEPVAWMHPEARWTDVSKQEVAVHCKVGTYPLPLYDSPVSDSMKAENERLREALIVASKYRMTADDIAIVDAALKGDSNEGR